MQKKTQDEFIFHTCLMPEAHHDLHLQPLILPYKKALSFGLEVQGSIFLLLCLFPFYCQQVVKGYTKF